MSKTNHLRVRRSIVDLQTQYEKGEKKPLEDLMRAWKGIKELPPENPRSFFNLAGFHGEPFLGAGWGVGNNMFWGGYCNHGNVLFPTWHRVYLVKLEEALRSIDGCEDVSLPYWDESDEHSIRNGVPWALTTEYFMLDGELIPNPLRSFVFPMGVSDSVSSDDSLYTKPKGYETVRYPLSGLVGNEAGRQQTQAHNNKYPDYERNVDYLNFNITGWLRSGIVVNDQPIKTGVVEKFKRCLESPNYTVFSNTSSAQQWNTDIWLKSGEEPTEPYVALESPHNDIHLAVGGFDVPGQGDFSPVEGANGDMGENNTAAFDPIFYFHHCNIDRVFWLWQKRHNSTDELELIEYYPGTNSSDNQGSTPGIPPNTWLTLDSPLNPFKKVENGVERVYTSRDCINIEKQFGFTYSRGSLEDEVALQAVAERPNARVIRVTNVNRAAVKGSFVISAFATIDGQRRLIGSEAVLSRWNVAHCANCQTHLEVQAFFGVPVSLKDSVGALQANDIDVEIKTRKVSKNEPMLMGTNLTESADNTPIKYRVEVR